MNENKIELAILEMLNGGHSYSEIELALGVSSKTIAKVNAIKKGAESARDEGFNSNTFPENSSDFQNTFQNPTEIQRSHSTVGMMESHKESLSGINPTPGSKSEAEIRVEEHRLEFEHEFRMREFEWKVEKEKKEMEIQAAQLAIRNKLIEEEQQKHQQQLEYHRKSFAGRLKKLLLRCDKAVWPYNDFISLYNDGYDLYHEAKRFCETHFIAFESTEFEQILDYFCDRLDDIIDSMDEGDEIAWEPDEDLTSLQLKSSDVNL